MTTIHLQCTNRIEEDFRIPAQIGKYIIDADFSSHLIVCYNEMDIAHNFDHMARPFRMDSCYTMRR